MTHTILHVTKIKICGVFLFSSPIYNMFKFAVYLWANFWKQVFFGGRTQWLEGGKGQIFSITYLNLHYYLIYLHFHKHKHQQQIRTRLLYSSVIKTGSFLKNSPGLYNISLLSLRLLLPSEATEQFSINQTWNRESRTVEGGKYYNNSHVIIQTIYTIVSFC